ncbi:hypothetical protein [Bacillus sp. LL01]|uniref:N-acyl amino acid synthase FeeM domain-containing protein n=1 Tax=Bacillus sp. LL01 TaxID=1665556 RepID=UPI00069EA5C3|nr:hypothetical protein [Bacillus sp. LL01]
MIQDEEKLKEFYELRYQTFVVDQGAAPRSFYPDQQLKDDFDKDGIHIGCYLDERLVGTLSLILKKDDLLMIEKVHGLESDDTNKYAEAMRFIIVEDEVTKKLSVKGTIVAKILKELDKAIMEHEITHVYVQSSEKGQKLYENIGFEVIGDYKMYEGISNECPMLLDINKANHKILQGVSNDD